MRTFVAYAWSWEGSEIKEIKKE